MCRSYGTHTQLVIISYKHLAPTELQEKLTINITIISLLRSSLNCLLFFLRHLAPTELC